MKSDNLKYFSLIMAMGSIASQTTMYDSDYNKPTNALTSRRKSTIKKMTEEQKAIKNGLKRFEYVNGFIYALNQKNADKKAKKQGLI